MKKRMKPDIPMIRGWAINTKVDGQVGLGLVDNSGCKWPLDLDESPTKFCGLPPEDKSPYCHGHSKIGHNLRR